MNSNDPLMGMADSMLKIREMEAQRMKEAIAEFHDGLDEDTRRRRKAMNDPNEDALWEWEARTFTLDTGQCPECDGTNLTEDRTKCRDCDPKADSPDLTQPEGG